MITQTLAIFLDSYRELNARRMFWIVLLLSALAIGGFAAVGVTDHNLRVLWWDLPSFGMPPQIFYKQLFSSVVVRFWLAWAATILALISTASIFPDFVAGGSIDLFLSKPITRVRLFFTKYFAALLFVFLQVSVFCIVGYFILGMRGHFWRPAIFWAIPIILCFFSYLFSVCVLIGIATRSTLTALLLTILFWFMCWTVGSTELVLFTFQSNTEHEIATADRQLKTYDDRIARLEAHPPGTTNPAQRILDDFKATRQRIADQREENITTRRRYENWHRLAYVVKTVIPKTSDTISLLDRAMLTDQEIAQLKVNEGESEPAPETQPRRRRRNGNNEAQIEVQQQLRQRSITWIVGTSLLFEALILGLAASIFARRDY
jgi:ABC-type transport system involved in multi-copper enzyme maturation permease subunit